MIDAPGPWGSGPFTLVEGYSSLENEVAMIEDRPLAGVWLDTNQPRTDRLVLEANTDHWNKERGPRLERVVFRNNVAHDKALELVCTTEGEIDIVTEVDPSDAERVKSSEHAQLHAVDAMRIVTGVINRFTDDVPLRDANARRALNLAVDRDRLVREGFAGYAHALSGLTPHYAGGFSGAEPYPHDPEEARRLMSEAGWPEGRALRLAATSDVEPVANMLAEDYRNALGIEVELTIIPDEELLVAQHTLVEKVMELPFDVLVHAWIDLNSDAPPAFIHGAYFAADGPFRAGPPLDDFEELMGSFATEIDAERQGEIAAQIDQFVYDEALSVFLVAPQALYAINRHVNFVGHAATFELAETEVNEEHWSRRNGQ
ncbi:MAG: ABC transporter, substrate-binding protein (cluster 5, nickel/peptides/opines) [uncultured Rubrobacteraceae bacterium]|uniref:ABC transporter, substrate-binding protein (Cluster 5, nickel/peptides/opines) n=1 Tax=uncultured Rubrobacteraceae bacterium TaxID=349277 RepID=A0A6J4QYW1_9ACTN|nr:MAG: ABC transporter, substrate-binding protein (cluster 5, nickel/peptides/opines) [uncultured Rubrobacteraceae bacterium]